MGESPCRPIGFVDELVRRILAGEKTRTRRIAAFKALKGSGFNPSFSGLEAGHYFTEHPASGWVLRSRGAGACWNDRTERLHCPFGVPGDLLWVRESYRFLASNSRGDLLIYYPADGAQRWVTLTELEMKKLRARKRPFTAPTPGRFLYRSCARLFLRLESVKVERLQDITEEEAVAEGMESSQVNGPKFWLGPGRTLHATARAAFFSWWDRLHGEPGAGAADNPWAWAVGFSVHQVLVRSEGRAA